MNPQPKTFSAKPAEALAERKWWVVDATDKPLGRLASDIATVLRGKHKPTYTPHDDTGDFVIVVNARQGEAHGRQARQEVLLPPLAASRAASGARATGTCSSASPTFPIEKAVKGMLPKNVLGREMLTKLKVYAGAGSSARGAEARSRSTLKLAQKTPHGRHDRPAPTPPASARPPSRASGSSPAPARSPSTSAPPTSTSSARPRAWCMRQSLELIEALDQFDVWATVRRRRHSAQAEAMRHGIARALIALDPEKRTVAQARRLPHARRAQEGAQEVRSAGRPQALPVLQALSPGATVSCTDRRSRCRARRRASRRG